MTIVVGFTSSLRKHMAANPTIIEIVHGIETEANQRDIMVTIRSLGYDVTQPSLSEQELPKELLDGRADGMVVLGHAPPSLFEQLTQGRIAFVAIEEAMGYSQVNCVMPDHYTAGYMPTKYLLDLGHRRIAYAGAPREFHSIRLQTLGYHDAMLEAGVPDSGQVVIDTPLEDYADLQTGRTVAEKVMAMSPQPTAVIFGGEVDAAEALRHFQSHGLSVPGDVSVIASGSTTMPLARSVHPPLTNMSCVSDERLGAEAVKRLVEIVTQGVTEATHKEVLPVKLTIQGSTAPPRG
jgi:LacI family transcriptional regulator